MARIARNNWMKKVGLISGVVGTLVLGGMNHDTHALTLNHTPDMTVENIGITYSAGASGTNYTAYGTAVKYNGVDLLTNPYFDLFASIGTSGALYNGNFVVYDDTTNNDSYDVGEFLYLSGVLTSLNTTIGDPVVNLYFTPTGGVYASDYGTSGAMILGYGIGPSGFNLDYNPPGKNGAADIGTPVPEPSSIALLLLGAGGLCLFRRRQSRV